MFPAHDFTPGIPAYLPGRAILVDRQMCREMKCPDCSREGLSYAPLRRGMAYRAQAVCTCGFREEI